MPPKSRTKLSAEFSVAVLSQEDYYRDREGPKLAARWRHSVTTKLNDLKTLPQRAPVYRFEAKQLQEIRWVAVPGFPFLIFYRFLKNENVVEVLMAIHTARDIESAMLSSLSIQ